MDCHISFSNTWMRVFRDQEMFKHCAAIPEIIQNDHHANWDRSHYDFGHYWGKSAAGRCNFKARYPILRTPKII